MLQQQVLLWLLKLLGFGFVLSRPPPSRCCNTLPEEDSFYSVLEIRSPRSFPFSLTEGYSGGQYDRGEEVPEEACGVESSQVFVSLLSLVS